MPARLSERERLSRLAKRLQASRNPYFVWYPLPLDRHTFPCVGWYWIPAGGEKVELLAVDAFDAYHRLMSMIEAADTTEEAA
jgi:hypothetical protein